MPVLIVICDGLIAVALALVGVQLKPAEHNMTAAGDYRVQSGALR